MGKDVRVLSPYFLLVAVAATFGLTIGYVPDHMLRAGYSGSWIGVTVGAYAAGALVVRIGIAGALDRGTLPRAEQLAAAMLVGGSAIYFAPAQYWLIAKALHGSAAAIVAMIVFGAAGRVGRRSDAGRRLGLLGATATVPIVVLPAAGLWLAHQSETAVACAVMAASLAALAIVLARRRVAIERTRPVVGDGSAPARFEPFMWIVAIAMATAPLGLVETALPSIARHSGGGGAAMLYLIFGMALAGGRAFGGWLCDVTRASTIATGGTLAMAGAACIALAIGGAVDLVLAALVLGSLIGITVSAAFVAVSATTAADRQSGAMGRAAIGHDAGIALGASLAGPFLASPVSVYFIAALFASLSFAATLLTRLGPKL